MCRRGRPHDELLETVLEASSARMTPSDPFSARLINGSRQRLLFFRGLEIDGTGAKCALRIGSSRSQGTATLEDFAKAAQSPHDTGCLNRKEHRRSFSLSYRGKRVQVPLSEQIHRRLAFRKRRGDSLQGLRFGLSGRQPGFCLTLRSQDRSLSLALSAAHLGFAHSL